MTYRWPSSETMAADDQLWLRSPCAEDAPYFFLCNRSLGTQVLEVRGRAEAASLRMSEFDGSDRQKWMVDGESRLTSKLDASTSSSCSRVKYCIDVIGARDENGASVCAYAANGGWNQRWDMEVVDKASSIELVRIVSKMAGQRLLTVENGDQMRKDMIMEICYLSRWCHLEQGLVQLQKVVWNHGVPEAIVEERLGKQLGKGTGSDDKGSGKDADTVLARVLPVNSQTGTSWHPKIEHGLCVSGGGSRAFAYSMGVYRALHELQLIPRLDAISSVSGGTWCSSIFMFARSFKGRSISTEELLGPGTKPSELSMEFLRRDVAPIASGIVHCDSDKIIVELLAKFKGREWEVWSHVMSAWLLRDFDELKSFDAYMASSEESVEKIRANNPELKESLFLTPRSDRPGTFIMVGTLRAPLGKLASLENVVLFQMSPDYTGNPFYPEDQQVVYDGLPICPCDACCYTCSPLSRTVGGGFVETFAFGGLAPSTQEEGLTEVGKPEKPFALPYAVAISSWAPANYMELSRVTADHLNQRQRRLSTPFGTGDFDVPEKKLAFVISVLWSLKKTK
ncbi:unnamed protein product [Cladocopium goreaui]|uniref:J domain-containing protein n=1 Tax=Cladocopium goreaui TaxID=2562237 RepID=A0A9P1FRA2_9DINO|nr:unnamed protein product [Cladocopium goreaui]